MTKRFDSLRVPEDIPSSCNQIVQTIKQCLALFAPLSTMDETETDDGGVVLEFNNKKKELELTFAIPKDGNVFYFVAIGPKYENIGAVTDYSTLKKLASWMAGTKPLFLEEKPPIASRLEGPPERPVQLKPVWK